MNRIIIVGNGFDLAHGVKTSYKDFIEWYFGEVVEKLKRDYYYKDDLLEIKTGRNAIDMSIYTNPIDMSTYIDNAKSNLEIIKKMKDIGKEFTFKFSPLLERIIKDVENKGWVDIETDYYELLKDYALNKRGDVKQLNKELSCIENKLIEYLKIEQDKFDEFYIEEDLQDIIYEPFSYISVSLKGKKCLDEHIEQDCKDI